MPSQGNVQRKLAAIMFTDIAGFTAFASKNEQAALDLLEQQRKIVAPVIQDHNGVLHKELGDGLLVSFNLTSEAVKCAVEIQRAVKNTENLNLRIGIHEGEIAISGSDVLGDDVNVASRIEPFSAIGGVSVSGKVQQNISSNPDFETELIAKPHLKGVNQEVSVYALVSDNLPLPDKTAINAKLEKNKGFSREILLSTAFGVLLFIVGFTYFSESGQSSTAGISAEKKEKLYYPESEQIIVNQIDSLLAVNDLAANDMAFDLASELEFTDSSIVDYKLLTAHTIFQRALLKENNQGLLNKSQSMVSEIMELDFLDYKLKAYGYYILSHIEYLTGDKDLAVKHIRSGFRIFKNDPTIKGLWQKLNREQLKGWEGRVRNFV